MLSFKMDIFYGIMLLLYFGSSDFVSGTPVVQGVPKTNNVLCNRQAQHNVDKNLQDSICFCNKDQSDAPTVSKQLNPNDDKLERLVLYLYKNKANGKVFLYVPETKKQHSFPDQSLHTQDLLEPVDKTPFAQLLINNPYVVTKEVFSKVPDFEANIPKPQHDVKEYHNNFKQLLWSLKQIVEQQPNEFVQVIKNYQFPLEQQESKNVVPDFHEGYPLNIFNETHYVLLTTDSKHKHNIVVPKTITKEQYVVLLNHLHHPKVDEKIQSLPEVFISTVADEPVTAQYVDFVHNTVPSLLPEEEIVTQGPTLVPDFSDHISVLPVQHAQKEAHSLPEVHFSTILDEPVTAQHVELAHNTVPSLLPKEEVVTQFPTLVPDFGDNISVLPIQHIHEEVQSLPEVILFTIPDETVTAQHVELAHNTVPSLIPKQEVVTPWPTLVPDIPTVADEPVTAQHVDIIHNTIPSLLPKEKVVPQFPTLVPDVSDDHISVFPVQHIHEEAQSLPEVHFSSILDKPVTAQYVDLVHNTEPFLLPKKEVVTQLLTLEPNISTDEPVTARQVDFVYNTVPYLIPKEEFVTEFPTLVPDVSDHISVIPVQNIYEEAQSLPEVHFSTIWDEPVTAQHVELAHNTVPSLLPKEEVVTQFPTLVSDISEHISVLPVQHAHKEAKSLSEVYISTEADEPVTAKNVEIVHHTVPPLLPEANDEYQQPTYSVPKHFQEGLFTAVPSYGVSWYDVPNVEHEKSVTNVPVYQVPNYDVAENVVQEKTLHNVAKKVLPQEFHTENQLYFNQDDDHKCIFCNMATWKPVEDQIEVENSNEVLYQLLLMLQNQISHGAGKSKSLQKPNFELLLKLILTHPEIKNKFSVENIRQILSLIYTKNNHQQSPIVQQQQKFDSWFNQQMQTINYDKAEAQSHLIDKNSLKLIIYEQLVQHGFHIFNNLLIDRDGTVVNINDLQLVPLLVGKDVGAQNMFNLSLPDLFKLFNQTPYFYALLLKLRSSGKPIGIVPLSDQSDLIGHLNENGGSQQSIEGLLKLILEQSNMNGHKGQISSSKTKYYFTSVPFELTEKPLASHIVNGKKIYKNGKKKSNKARPLDARLLAFFKDNKDELTENSYKKLSSVILNPPLVDGYISGANPEELQNEQWISPVVSIIQEGSASGNSNLVPLSENNPYGDLANFLQETLGLKISTINPISSQVNSKVGQNIVSSLELPSLNKKLEQDNSNQVKWDGLKLNLTGYFPEQSLAKSSLDISSLNSGVDLKLPNVAEQIEKLDLSWNGALPSESHNVGESWESLADLPKLDISRALPAANLDVDFDGMKSALNWESANPKSSIDLSSNGELKVGLPDLDPSSLLKSGWQLNAEDSKLNLPGVGVDVEKSVDGLDKASEKIASPTLDLNSNLDASSLLDSNLGVDLKQEVHPVSASKLVAHPIVIPRLDTGGLDFEVDIDKDDYLTNDGDDEGISVKSNVRLPSVPTQHSSNPQYRIIGGSAATGSGVPLSNRGREGVIELNV